MIIQQSKINMNSLHQAMQRLQHSERLESWIGQRPQRLENPANNPGGERVSLSQRGQGLAQQATAQEAKQAKKVEKADQQDDDKLDPKLMLIKMAIESLTGQKIKLVNLQNFSVDAEHSVSAEQSTSQQVDPGFGIDYQRHTSYTESESLDFSASGTVRTADGQELQFSLDISLQRSFSMQTDERIQIGNAVQSKDPLAINLDAPAAKLTDQKFDFDVDSDGKADKVSMLQPGSGFLALDKNGDGKVNDGSELFGTKSGNGFADLAKFDQDGNNWIDQADAIFKKLKIWLKDAAGKDSLIDLSQAKIGAIFLGNTKTDFKHADANNNTNGNLRSSGVYLKDDGKAGSVQQIDLAV